MSRFNLPVVISGETGCGKSTLIRNLCAIMGTPLHILNVHGGMEEKDIVEWMTDKVKRCQSLGLGERIIVFLGRYMDRGPVLPFPCRWLFNPLFRLLLFFPLRR